MWVCDIPHIPSLANFICFKRHNASLCVFIMHSYTKVKIKVLNQIEITNQAGICLSEKIKLMQFHTEW